MKDNYYGFITIFLTIISFSFYISPGSSIQMYQLLFYPVAIALIISNILKQKNINKGLLLLFMILVIMLILAVMSSLLNNRPMGDIVKGLKNMIDPILVVSLFMFEINDNLLESPNLVVLFSKYLSRLLLLNTIWIFVTMFFNVSLINQYFWGGLDTVATRALGNGRYSGIFNQPMESGTAYSLGIIFWDGCLKENKRIKIVNIIELLAILIGGILSVSKVFIFVGLPLFIIKLVLQRFNLKKFVGYTFIFGLFIVLFNYLSKFWSGTSYLFRFFKTNSNQTFLNTITAGRLGGDSQQMRLFKEIYQENPLFGKGFGYSAVYDSLYFYFFSIIGIIGIIFLIVLFIKLSKDCYLIKNKERRIYLMSLILLLVIGGVGAPILVLNRVNILFYVSICICYIKYEEKREKI